MDPIEEDSGEHEETAAFHAQAREVAELADVRVLAAVKEGRPIGFAQVETHDAGSEVTQVFCFLSGVASASEVRSPRWRSAWAPRPRGMSGFAPSVMAAHAGSTSSSASGWSSRQAWRSCRRSPDRASGRHGGRSWVAKFAVARESRVVSRMRVSSCPSAAPRDACRFGRGPAIAPPLSRLTVAARLGR